MKRTLFAPRTAVAVALAAAFSATTLPAHAGMFDWLTGMFSSTPANNSGGGGTSTQNFVNQPSAPPIGSGSNSAACADVQQRRAQKMASMANALVPPGSPSKSISDYGVNQTLSTPINVAGGLSSIIGGGFTGLMNSLSSGLMSSTRSGSNAFEGAIKGILQPYGAGNVPNYGSVVAPVTNEINSAVNSSMYQMQRGVQSSLSGAQPRSSTGVTGQPAGPQVNWDDNGGTLVTPAPGTSATPAAAPKSTSDWLNGAARP